MAASNAPPDRRSGEHGDGYLAVLALSFEVPPERFLPPNRSAYLLLKLIHYIAPPAGMPQSGVAPHVDSSWITLLLQDETGGLEICMPDGAWTPVPPVPGAQVVNTGEILEFQDTRALPGDSAPGCKPRGAAKLSWVSLRR
jgi:isopenicillin N synthase-like dioxygenase